jgi:hypothetical protein
MPTEGSCNLQCETKRKCEAKVNVYRVMLVFIMRAHELSYCLS